QDASSAAQYDLLGMAINVGHMAAYDPSVTLITNLHTHGLQVSPSGNGDNQFIQIAPGEYLDYDIAIPSDQPPGLDWYHPHFDHSSSAQAWNGLAGAIVVEGGIDALPEIAAARERLMVVNELWFDDDGEVPLGVFAPSAGPVDFTVANRAPA